MTPRTTSGRALLHHLRDMFEAWQAIGVGHITIKAPEDPLGFILAIEAEARAANGTPASAVEALDVDAEAAQALYDDPDLEVGQEGIGGFAADQAEEVIAVLRRAGFRIVRFSEATPSEDAG